MSLIRNTCSFLIFFNQNFAILYVINKQYLYKITASNTFLKNCIEILIEYFFMELSSIIRNWDIMFQYIRFDVKHPVYWHRLQIALNLGDNKTGAASSCPLKLQKMVIDLANLNIFWKGMKRLFNHAIMNTIVWRSKR